MNWKWKHKFLIALIFLYYPSQSFIMALEIPYTSLSSLPFLSFYSFISLFLAFSSGFLFLTVLCTALPWTIILWFYVCMFMYHTTIPCMYVQMFLFNSCLARPDLVFCPFFKGLPSPFHSSHSCMDSLQHVSIFPTMVSQGYEQPSRCCPRSFSIIEKI